ncbi:MAG: hypothetical protein J2P21_04860 [Chloracidobacterium sp.]|nr:hypothetical protein [Chloracidobacterium sp.]
MLDEVGDRVEDRSYDCRAAQMLEGAIRIRCGARPVSFHRFNRNPGFQKVIFAQQEKRKAQKHSTSLTNRD